MQQLLYWVSHYVPGTVLLLGPTVGPNQIQPLFSWSLQATEGSSYYSNNNRCNDIDYIHQKLWENVWSKRTILCIVSGGNDTFRTIELQVSHPPESGLVWATRGRMNICRWEVRRPGTSKGGRGKSSSRCQEVFLNRRGKNFSLVVKWQGKGKCCLEKDSRGVCYVHHSTPSRNKTVHWRPTLFSQAGTVAFAFPLSTSMQLHIHAGSFVQMFSHKTI